MVGSENTSLWSRALYGRLGSSKDVYFGTNRKRVCNVLLVINSNLGPLLPRFRDIAGFRTLKSLFLLTYLLTYLHKIPACRLFRVTFQSVNDKTLSSASHTSCLPSRPLMALCLWHLWRECTHVATIQAYNAPPLPSPPPNQSQGYNLLPHWVSYTKSITPTLVNNGRAIIVTMRPLMASPSHRLALVCVRHSIHLSVFCTLARSCKQWIKRFFLTYPPQDYASKINDVTPQPWCAKST